MTIPHISKPDFFSRLEAAKIILPSGTPGRDEQEQSLNFLLDRIAADPHFQNDAATQQASYLLATIAHECCVPVNFGHGTAYVRTFAPVREVGGNEYFDRNYGNRTDLGNTQKGDGAKFKGRGFVQNTGRKNAAAAGRRLAGHAIFRTDLDPDDQKVIEAFDRAAKGGTSQVVIVDENTFVKEPDLLLVPEVSYLDAVSGMFEGRYTGRKITDFISGDGTHADFYNARSVINGDKQKNGQVIADIARTFVEAFNAKPASLPDPAAADVLAAGAVGAAAGAGTVIAADAVGADFVSNLTGGQVTTTTVISKAKTFKLGWFTAAIAAVSSFYKANPLMFWGAVAIVVALIVTGAYVYVERMKVNTDPAKHNVL